MANNMRINELFEKQAKNNPFGKAVVYCGKWITYQALDKKSNQFARYLQSIHQIKSNDVVGLSVENKGINLIIAILSILKIGAAYQPLTVNYCPPTMKLSKHQHLACILSDNPHIPHNYININQIENLSQNHSDQPISTVIKTGDSIAYLISTSGTTGHPKTIAISHDNLIATSQSWQHIYELNTSDRHLQMANFSFDVFTGDWVRALCSGGTLILCPKNYLLSPELLASFIEMNQITIAEFVPAILRKLMFYLEEKRKKLPTFRLLICGSDIWYISECKKLKQFCGPKTRIINSYGLTETTIDAIYYEYSEENSTHLKEESIVPIGKPFPHASVQVITSAGEPAKVGEQGEIYIGGQGVSKYGYLDNPELAEKKFIRSKDGKDLYYKTGDVAEILESGDILFLGRNEAQFNIHGQRVDFLSVESVLLQHTNVKSAIVIPNTIFDTNFLEAFLVLSAEVSYEELIDHLKAHLPSYAIPRYFYEIDQVVLSDNNKIIREKSQQKIVRKITGHFIAPTTHTQIIIARIWEEILRQKPVDINSSFDLLGGTSLEYVKIISEINSVFHTNINLCRKLNTITEMAGEVDRMNNPSAYANHQYQEIK